MICQNLSSWPGNYTRPFMGDLLSAELQKRGFCIFINTVFQGAIPIERDGDTNFAYIYPTRNAAEREIAEDVIERLNQFLEGERDFEDAINPEEYIVEVRVLPDGSVIDEAGYCFGNEVWYRGG